MENLLERLLPGRARTGGGRRATEEKRDGRRAGKRPQETMSRNGRGRMHGGFSLSKRMKPMRCEIGDGVVAVGIKARDLGDSLDAPSNAAALDENHEVDRQIGGTSCRESRGQ